MGADADDWVARERERKADALANRIIENISIADEIEASLPVGADIPPPPAFPETPFERGWEFAYDRRRIAWFKEQPGYLALPEDQRSASVSRFIERERQERIEVHSRIVNERVLRGDFGRLRLKLSVKVTLILIVIAFFAIFTIVSMMTGR